MKEIIKYIILSKYFLLMSSGLIAQKNNGKMMRWDHKMINEANIWKNLLVDYSKEGKDLYWHERKQAFTKVVTDFPNSQWADDAALLLAGEQALIDHNLDEAIISLRGIKKKYPSENTIIDNWNSQRGCHMDEAWLMWAPSLVLLNEDNSIRISFPFDRDGKISILEEEVLTYFDHREKHPQRTKDVAQLIIATMLQQNGKVDEAILELEKLLAGYPDLSKVRTIDFEAAKTENGHLIGHEPPFDALPIWRIQYSAGLLLVNLYLQQNRIEEALTICSKLWHECSPDGWYWSINKYIGSIYANNNQPRLASKQYDISLNGIKEKSKNQDFRMNALLRTGNAIKPEGFISWEEEAIKTYSVYLIEIERLKNQLIFK